MSARALVLMTVAGSAERNHLLPPEQRAPRRACSGRATRRSKGLGLVGIRVAIATVIHLRVFAAQEWGLVRVSIAASAP